MSARKELSLARRDPLGLLRQMTSEFDTIFDDPFGRSSRWPARLFARAAAWAPEIDVFEKDARLIARIDLPGMKKEDVKVEVTNGQLAISGERQSEAGEKQDNYYRSERQYGRFYRAVPLPEGVKLEDVTAAFSHGVLEVSVPLPNVEAARVHKVEIAEGPAASKAA